jgi:lipopolysaccharide/colanic/teichoic acid biosynthesis glycosyltransferase
MSVQAMTPEVAPFRRIIRASSGENKETEKDLCYLYIGSDDKLSLHFSGYFVAGNNTDNLAHAEEFLASAPEHSLPDVIFIDVPLQAAPLKGFCSFLKKNKSLRAIPVIYSLTQLMKSRMAFSAQMKLIDKAGCIDDILDIDRHTINYTSKIAFLKQARLKQEEMDACRKKNRLLRFNGRAIGLVMKRAIDIIVASIAIILLSPVLLMIAIAIRLESRGPVFYTALRAGRCFKIFRFYKFRSMVNNADKRIEALAHMNQYDGNESGPKFFKIVNDPRVTRLGRFLRNTSLDELPQLFNVLKGDMSIVGNRPLPLYEAETLTTDEFMERFNAPAGITGLWQVKKRGKTDMSVEERINLDISYARNISFLMDCGIIARTPMALFQKSNV